MTTYGLSRGIPYSSHITPEIIKLRDGIYLMAFEIEGAHYVGQNEEDVDQLVLQINKFISTLRAPYRYNVYLQMHCIRGEGEAFLPAHFSPGSFAERLNAEYEDKVIYGRPIMAGKYYLSLLYRPYRRIAGSNAAIKTGRAAIEERAKAAEEVLERLKGNVLTFFVDHGVRILTCYDEGETTFSQPLAYLSKIINLTARRVPLQRGQIHQYLPTATLSMGNSEIIRIDDWGQTRYAAILTLAEYPTATETGMLQPFLELPWPMVVTQTFAPIDKKEAKKWLDTEYRRMESGDETSAQDMQDIVDAREGVQSDNFILGDYYWSAMLLDETPEGLRKKLSEAQAILSNCGFGAAVNRISRLHSYLAQLPGNIDKQPRAAKVSSLNAAQMMPFLRQNRGKADGNMWGSAVAMLRTVSDEIFYFNFHDPEKNHDARGEDVAGNTIIAGATGTGKTVLLSFLLAQTQRYKVKPRLVIFDKDFGSSIFVRVLGGQYSQIELGKPTGFNPFSLANNETNRTFLHKLILALLANDGEKISAAENRQITEAIEQVMDSDVHLRDIESFANYLPDGDNSIRQRLYPWTQGNYSWVFNNAVDNFEISADIIGIDYTQFLNIPAICTPILMYLMHRIQELLDGRPLIMSFDEAKAPLSVDYFRGYLDDKSRVIRKERGLLIFATQSPGDFYRSVDTAFMDQVATQILLPNPRAEAAVYMDKLGFTPEEFHLVKSLGKYSREFLVRYQGETAHCKLDMKGIDAVKILSGSKARAELADKLIARYGADPDLWLPAYAEALSKSITEVSAEDDVEAEASSQPHAM